MMGMGRTGRRVRKGGDECRRRSVFFFNDTATTEIYTLSLHDALPIFKLTPSLESVRPALNLRLLDDHSPPSVSSSATRSEEHTSELQSRQYLVCRLLLEKKNTPTSHAPSHPPSSHPSSPPAPYLCYPL